MGNVHLTLELLESVFGEERSPRELIPVVLAHLFDLCPHCERTFDEWRKSIPVAMTLSYGEIASNALDKANTLLDRIREEEERARVYLEDLLTMAPEERVSFIEAVPEEAKGLALAHGLIEAARGAMPGRPHDSLALAQLARTVLQHADLSPFTAELYARAVAYVGNARRVLGNLPEAAEDMAHARFILRQEGGGDRLTRSELDNLEGMVRLHQRNYPEAERLLKRAILGFRFAGAEREAVRSRLNLGFVYQQNGNLKACLETQRGVVEALSRSDEPLLQYLARHNLALFLCDARQYVEAARLLEFNKKLAGAPSDNLTQLRVLWLEGTIAYGIGSLESAESHLSTARYGFEKLELAFDAALVSLELACVYLTQNRPGEVQRLAGDLVSTFEGQERRSEALAAVLLFRAAAELERVTVDFIKDLTVYLRQAALDPSFKFGVRRESVN